MLSNTINPVLGIEDSRLRSLPFEIIGFSNVTTIRLPSDPAFSPFKHDRQLLLRLKWMFDAFHFAHFDSTKVLKVPNLERSVALRLFLRLLKLCSPESIKNVSTADYHIWRYLALESVLSGMQVIISELQELDQDEEDLIEEEIQKVATTWHSTHRLTTTEECLLEQILPGSRGQCYDNDVKLHRISQGAVESMAIDITTAINAQTLQPAGFWRLYNTVSETIYYLTVATSDRPGTFGPAHAHFILKAGTDKLKSSNLEPGPVAIVQHQLKRLSFAIEQVQPSSSELEILLNDRIARRLKRIVIHESSEFRRWLQVDPTDISTINDSVSRWMEEKSSTISPASVQSDEHTTSLSLTRRESSVDHITNLSTLEIPQSQIPTVSSSSDTNPPISVPALFYESPKIPQTVNWSPVAAGEVSGDKREPAGQLGHTSVYIPSSYTRRHETVVTKVVPSRKPLPPTPVRAINNKSQPEVDTYTDTCAESKEIVKANDLSDETLTSAINSQRSSIRQTGLQLPVSTFTPTSRSENVQENVMTSDEESNVNERQLPPILAQTIIPGLEIAHRPPARVQTVAHRDRGPQPWARGQQPVESSEVHMLDTHPWNRKNDDSASTISRKRRYFFNFKSRSEKPTPTPLPASLELCFSSCGSNLILWCSKDAAQIIRIRHPFRSGQRYSLDLPESMDGKTPNTSIRYLASSGETIVALVHIGNSRRLYHIESTQSQSFCELDDDTPTIHALALSPNGNMVALGCGEYSLVYRMTNRALLDPVKLPHSKRPSRAAIRAQKLNFSVDSQRLVSCIQAERTSQKHDMYATIWICSDIEIVLDTQLDPVELSVGYMDDTGISSASLVSNPNTNTGEHVFLTAALAKSYPAVLSLSRSTKHKHLDLTDTHIDSSAQCISPISNHLFVIRMIRSGQHKILRVDSRTGATEPIMQFAAERKSSKVKYEPVAIAMLGSDTVLAAWRSSNARVIVRCHIIASGKWETISMDVADVYRQLAIN